MTQHQHRKSKMNIRDSSIPKPYYGYLHKQSNAILRGHSKCLACTKFYIPNTYVSDRQSATVCKKVWSVTASEYVAWRPSSLGKDVKGLMSHYGYVYVYRLCTVQSVSSQLSSQENSIIEVAMRAYWHSICIGCTPTKRYIRSIISLGFVKALAFPKKYIKGHVSNSVWNNYANNKVRFNRVYNLSPVQQKYVYIEVANVHSLSQVGTVQLHCPSAWHVSVGAKT